VRHRSKILNDIRDQARLKDLRKIYPMRSFVILFIRVRGLRRFKNLKRFKGSNKKSLKKFSNETSRDPALQSSTLFIKSVRMFSSVLNITQDQ